MAKQKSERPFCGAHAKQSGEPCKNRAVLGKKRCRFHGGTNPGPPKGSTNGLKHGIYKAGYSEEEIKDLDTIRATIGKLDEELTLAKVMLKRTWVAMATAEKDQSAGFEMSEIKQTQRPVAGVDAQGNAITSMQTTREVIQKRPDYRAISDRFLARITNMEIARSNLTLYEVELLRLKLEKMIESLE